MQVSFVTAQTNSIYACDGQSILYNGNLEDGNQGFSSDYINAYLIYPGRYAVTDFQGALNNSTNWNLSDHSTCEGGSGNKFMVVNGRTNQASGTYSIIYEVDLYNLDTDKTYQFGGFFKNLPQTSFDIKPRIRFQITNVGYYAGSWRTINQDASDVCAWEKETVAFSPTSSNITIRILLSEDGNGDGNDLAIDDLSLHILPELNLTMSTQVQSLNSGNIEVIASIHDIENTDDILPDDNSCRYLWLVAEANGGASSAPISNLSNTFVGGNYFSPHLDLTTTFPGYNGGTANGIFETNQLYLVLLYVYNCDCYQNDLVFQYVYSSDFMSNNERKAIPELNEEQKNELKSLLLDYTTKGHSFNLNNSINKKEMLTPNHQKSQIKIYPNPSKNIFNIDLNDIENLDTEITILDNTGKIISSYLTQESKMEIDLSNYPNGTYHIKIKQGDILFHERLIKIE